MSETSVSGRKVKARGRELEVLIPDTRGVKLSPWGVGNLKLGPNVYTYSKMPGLPSTHSGSCPGATPECLTWCYAFRIAEEPLIGEVYRANREHWQVGERLPGLPEDADLVRLHVSGDFDSIAYVVAWQDMAIMNRTVKFWGYTRSWRVPHLRMYLERLRCLENVQLFASIDPAIDAVELKVVAGWRKAWLEGDSRLRPFGKLRPNSLWAPDDTPVYQCPEEAGRKANCEECRYCFDGKKGDVAWVLH